VDSRSTLPSEASYQPLVTSSSIGSKLNLAPKVNFVKGTSPQLQMNRPLSGGGGDLDRYDDLQAKNNRNSASTMGGSEVNRSSIASSTHSFAFSGSSHHGSSFSSFQSRPLSPPRELETSVPFQASSLPSTLYHAACIRSPVNNNNFNKWRDNFPILVCQVGDLLEVFREEVDEITNDGNGWLLGRAENGVFGYVRSHDFAKLPPVAP
jgi:hypothetical protein